MTCAFLSRGTTSDRTANCAIWLQRTAAQGRLLSEIYKQLRLVEQKDWIRVTALQALHTQQHMPTELAQYATGPSQEQQPAMMCASLTSKRSHLHAAKICHTFRLGMTFTASKACR